MTVATECRSTQAPASRPAHPRHDAVKLRWRVLSLLLRTIGRASDGIDLGYRQGFDSGSMLDYVYENRARGRYGIGRLIDRLHLEAIGWRAIRERKTLLQATVRAELARRGVNGQQPVVLDVAAGPGRYLLELLEEVGPKAPTVICRDLSLVALEQGQRLAAARGLTSIRYEPGDACDPHSLTTVEPRPDLVVVSGLYELLLDTDLIHRSLAGIHAIMRPGGLLVFTTQVTHPQLEMIASVLPNRDGQPWVMECRSLPLVELWAAEVGFVDVASRTEPLGLFGVTTARKR